MKRLVVRLAKILVIIAGILAVIIIALHLVLNSGWMRKKIDKIAESALADGELRYSRLHFKTFPYLVAEIDSLSLTYPHGLFARYDGLGVRGPLLAEGRGAVEDTLVAADRLYASVNLWKIFGGRIRVSRLHLDHPRVYYHAYDGVHSNLDIIAKSDEPKDTSAKKSSGLPWISLGDVRIGDRPRIVYTSQADTVHARISFDELALRWKIRIKKDILASKIRKGHLQLDSLRLGGRLPSDTLAVAVNSLVLDNPETNLLDFFLDGDGLYFSPSLGSLQVPAKLDARLGFSKHRKHFDLDLDHLKGELAYIPLRAEGLFRKYEDHGYVKGSAGIDSCSLATVMEQYARKFLPEAKDVQTDAFLSLGVAADGNISEKEYPAVDASVDIPCGHVSYLPQSLRAMLDLGARAKLSPEGKLSADVERCHLRSNGVKLDLDGDGRDLIGRDPAVAARLGGFVITDSIVRYLPKSLDIRSSGTVDLEADVNAHLNELEDYIFRKTRISCRLSSNRLSVRMPSENLSAMLRRPEIKLSSAESSINLSADADSVAVGLSNSFHAALKGMVNRANVKKVENNGKMVPYLSFSTTEDLVKMYAGDNKIEAENALISLEAMQRVRRPRPRFKRFLDSLQRVYPGVPRDSLFAKFRAGRPVDDLAHKDLKVSLDSSFVALLNRWHPGGLVSLENATLVSPLLPLRTTLNSFDLALDDDDAQIASFNVDCGTSDIDLTGSVGGFRRFIRGRGPLKFNFDVHSKRLNANEILVAMQQAPDSSEVDLEKADFVVDSLANAQYDPSMGEMKAIVVPKNLRGTIRMKADRVDYSSLLIHPASAEINVRNRVLQLKDVDVQSNVGQIKMDAFYASKNKSDISAGVDIHLIDMPAYDIIHMLPTVDAMMPALKSFQGNLGCDLSLTTQLDTNMNVLTPTLNGLVRIAGEDLYIKNAGSLRKITRLLMFKNKNIGEIQNLYVDAVIGDNRVEVYPFVLGVDKYKVALAGTQGFNGSMRYNVSILESFLPFRFGINIYGNLDKWRFSLGRNKYRNGLVPSFTADLDTMQVNLLDVIRNVYNRGVQNAMVQMDLENKRLEKSKMLHSYTGAPSDEMLSKEEFQQVDSLMFTMQTEEENQEQDAALDAALDEALASLNAQQVAWLDEHPWAEAALSRAEQRRAERERRKAEKEAAASEKGRAAVEVSE
ncbi:MAG: hypothetical protein K5652_05155 [Bacteroidales bacterium]|nr:hypothetical protein [Bacteroidales bacterium]